ncbi:MAG: hypothetical protein ACT6QU_14690 [Aliihoeflea sp.]|uniref:hypothetical protein n=1 Tax=Aliihoeflea sp. TaxID=2608088 RepID=UPI0040340E2E
MKSIPAFAFLGAVLALLWTSGVLSAACAVVLALYVREITVRRIVSGRLAEAVAYIEREDEACTCVADRDPAEGRTLH